MSHSGVGLIIITKGDTFGGASKYVLLISSILYESLGIRPVVICGAPGTFTSLLNSKNIDCIFVPSLSNSLNPLLDFNTLISIIKIINELKPKFLLLNSGKAGLIGRIASLIINVPAIYVVHGWSFVGWRHRPLRLISYFSELLSGVLFLNSCRYIFVSNYDKMVAPLPPASLRTSKVIHNGINPIPLLYSSQSFKRLQRRLRFSEALSDPSLFTFVSVCRLDLQKDVRSLLQAMMHLRDCNLIIVGSGPNQKSLEQFAIDMGIDDRVLFSGFVDPDSVSSFCALSDAFVLSSNWEGFPFSIVEAMHYGLPVMLSDVGGCCEVFSHGISVGATWGSRNDPAKIASALSLYIDDHSMAERHGLNALFVARTFYSFDRMKDSTCSFISSVLQS